MSTKEMTIRELLQEQLDKRSHITDSHMKVEDIFVHNKAVHWITDILGKDQSNLLEHRLNDASAERLSHAISTYLIGIALREHLDMRFDLLPRLITAGTGDAFHFFWAIICLCHDLGYEFENKENTLDERKLMNSSDGRKRLLGIDHDLFEVSETDLTSMGLDSNSATSQWILETIPLAKKYDAMRRRDTVSGTHKPVLDHGICGALILYDILRKEYDNLVERRKKANTRQVNRHDTTVVEQGILPILEKDASIRRFAECCLVVACTVARHNMWIAKDEPHKVEDNPIILYPKYDLFELLPSQEAKISADSPHKQMLFLLGFIDTIDPVKSLYTRDAELKIDSTQELEEQKNFLLDKVKFNFCAENYEDFRWAHALTYRKMTISAASKNDKFDNYQKNVKHLSDWLNTKAPQTTGNEITVYIPCYPSKRNHWIGGISDYEVNSLLLYMGAGVPGKYGKFYSCLDAYKTLNLLLMPGLDGEKVRVCQEHQIPNSIYIQQWRMTLDVLVDIFTAQCKYAVHVGQPPKKTLYRGDRGINYQLMKQHNQTFALTSTSLGGYQEKFVKGKKEDCVLEIVIDKNVPYFDYARFFGDAYVFFDEAEVLLPPYITMTKTHSYDCDNLTHHHIHLDRFDMTSIDADEDDLIHALEQDCQSAANEFQDFVENAQKNITMLPSSDGSYARWKENFQKLCKLCMQNIYRSYYEI